MTDQPQDLIDAVRAIAAGAGAEIMRIYARDFDVDFKADESPLTEADMASHRHIVAALHRLTPELPVLSEESSSVDYAVRRDWQRFWLVDPLDGTKEFIKRNGEFTVNIALIDGHEPVLGVVTAPARDAEFFGRKGAGAWRVRSGGEPEPIAVSRREAGTLRVVGSRSHRGASLDKFLAKLDDYEMVPMGSSLKICLVADGTADVYPRLGPTSEWDTAAAHAVLVAAGGELVTSDGQPLRYNASPELLNPHFLAIGNRRVDWIGLL